MNPENFIFLLKEVDTDGPLRYNILCSNGASNHVVGKLNSRKFAEFIICCMNNPETYSEYFGELSNGTYT